MTIAFDCDGTLTTDYGMNPSPNWGVISILKWFEKNGDRIIIWSGGGEEYARHWAQKLNLDSIQGIIISAKTKEAAAYWKPDIVFDDEMVELGRVNVHIAPSYASKKGEIVEAGEGSTTTPRASLEERKEKEDEA